jgi:hypothetical protein
MSMAMVLQIFILQEIWLKTSYMSKGKSENASFHFEDITQKAGVNGRKRWKTGVSMADVNADGKLDIYVCYSGTGTDEDRRNELYINQGNQNGIPVFKESAEEYGLDAPGTYTTQVAFFDMDNDGDLDMFMVNHADMFLIQFSIPKNCVILVTINLGIAFIVMIMDILMM